MHYVITAHVPDLRIGEQSESLHDRVPEPNFSRTPCIFRRGCRERAKTLIYVSERAVYNHWTGLVDWTGGLDWWTDIKNHFYAF